MVISLPRIRWYYLNMCACLCSPLSVDPWKPPLVAAVRVILVRRLVHVHFDRCGYSGAVRGVAKYGQGGHAALLGCCITPLSRTSETEHNALDVVQLLPRDLLCTAMPGRLAIAADIGGRLRSAAQLSEQCLVQRLSCATAASAVSAASFPSLAAGRRGAAAHWTPPTRRRPGLPL
jgi:hypothetical protein